MELPRQRQHQRQLVFIDLFQNLLNIVLIFAEFVSAIVRILFAELVKFYVEFV